MVNDLSHEACSSRPLLRLAPFGGTVATTFAGVYEAILAAFSDFTTVIGRVARPSRTLRHQGVLLENSLTRYGAASILGISPLRAWDFRSERQPGGAPVEMTGDEFVDFAR